MSKFTLLAVFLLTCYVSNIYAGSLGFTADLQDKILRAPRSLEEDSKESSEETSAEVADSASKAGYTDEETKVVQRINRTYKDAKTVKQQSDILDEICRTLGKSGQIVPVPSSEASASDIQKNWEAAKDEPLKKKIEFWTNITEDKTKSKPTKYVATKNMCVLIWNAYQEILAERKAKA